MCLMNNATYQLGKIADYFGKTPNGNRFADKCPLHAGKGNTSFSAWIDKKGDVAVNCLGGCDHQDVIKFVKDEIGVQLYRDPPPEPQSDADYIPVKETWTYYHKDDNEALTAIVLRYPMRCKNPDCDDLYPHKHPFLDKTPAQKREDWVLRDGFTIKLHEPDANNLSDANTIIICEGQKTAEAVKDAGYIAASYIDGSNYAGRADYSPTFGYDVLIAPDNDYNGKKAAYESAKRCLEVRARSVTILPVVKGRPGCDLADIPLLERQTHILSGGHVVTNTVECDIQIYAEKIRFETWRKSDRPLMEASRQNDMKEHIEEVRRHCLVTHVYNKEYDPAIYNNQGQLVKILNTGTRLKMKPYTLNNARLMLSEAIYWYKGWTDDIVAVVSGPGSVTLEEVRDLLKIYEARPHGYLRYMTLEAKKASDEDRLVWMYTYPMPFNPLDHTIQTTIEEAFDNVPKLNAIRYYPILNQSHDAMLDKSMYYKDEAVRLSITDVEYMPIDDAWDIVWNIFKEFPFASDVDKANFIAALINPIISPSVPLTPLFSFQKSASGTGATYLAEIISMIYTGEKPRTIGKLKNTEEDQKQISAAANNTSSVVLADNFDVSLTSNEYETYLTSVIYYPRRLGFNDQIEIDKHHITDIMTGNNTMTSDAIERRTCKSYLDANIPDPASRTFDLNIRAYINSNRNLIINALASIVKHWIDLGCPDDGRKAIHSSQILGSYEEWQDLCADILWASGIKCFYTEKKGRTTASPGVNKMLNFVSWWWMTYGESRVTVKDLALPEVIGDDDHEPLIRLYTKSDSKRAKTTALGMTLTRCVNNNYYADIDKTINVKIKVIERNGDSNQYKLELVRDLNADYVDASNDDDLPPGKKCLYCEVTIYGDEIECEECKNL